MRTRLVLAITLLLALPVLTGCQSAEEALVSAEALADAPVASPVAQVDGELHVETPAELPLWPDALVEASDFEDGVYSLSLITPESMDNVVNGVALGLERSDWEAAADEIVGEPGSRVALMTIRRDGVEGFVTITEVGDDTTAIEYLLTLPE
jgi:hypothetical protein